MANGGMRERDSLRDHYDEDEEWWRDDGGKEEKKKEGSPVLRRIRNEVLNTLKTLAIVLIVLFLIIAGLVLYTGSWPPVAVVKSGSMMHDKHYSELGVLDTADLILVKDIDEKEVHREISTWVDKEKKHYGTWGDVIVYKADGGEGTPILHRALVWVEANLTDYDNSTRMGATYDVPSLDIYGAEGTIPIPDYPDYYLYENVSVYNVQVDFGRILNAYRNKSLTPQSGYITKGDANEEIDQPGLSLPIQPNWVLGKAVGEIPWYGIVNMKFQGNTEEVPPNSWGWFIGSLVVIIATPFALDFTIRAILRSSRKKKERERPQEAKIITEEEESRRIGGRDDWDDFDERFEERGYHDRGQRRRRDDWDDFDDHDDVARGYWDWYGQQEESRRPPPGRDEYEQRPGRRGGRRRERVEYEQQPRRRGGRRRERDEYEQQPRRRGGRRRERDEYRNYYDHDRRPPPPPWMQQQPPRYDDHDQYYHDDELPHRWAPPPQRGRRPPPDDHYYNDDDYGEPKGSPRRQKGYDEDDDLFDEEEEDWGDPNEWDDEDWEDDDDWEDNDEERDDDWD